MGFLYYTKAGIFLSLWVVLMWFSHFLIKFPGKLKPWIHFTIVHKNSIYFCLVYRAFTIIMKYKSKMNLDTPSCTTIARFVIITIMGRFWRPLFILQKPHNIKIN